MDTYVPAKDATTRAEDARRSGTPRPTVLLLISSLDAGAPERLAVELARGLDKSRFRVLIASLSESTLLEDELRDCPDVEVRTLGARGSWDATVLPSLVSLLRRERVDVVQPFWEPATVFGLAAAKFARTPVRIATLRGEEPVARAVRFLEDRLLRSATAAVLDSERAARALVLDGVPHAKVNVIYDGVTAESVRTNLRERQAVRSDLGVLDESWLIGVAEPMTAAADYGCFLQAASIVRAEAPGTKFMLLGDGPQRPELLRRAMILGLAGSLIFAGHQPRIAPYIAAMDVAVLPDLGPVNYGLEAMGLGRPVVAMDGGRNAELFPMGEAGLVVPPDNPIILAHAILEVMKHPDAVERMRSRGRELFDERFTMKRMVAAYEELYTDLWRRRETSGVPGDAEPVSGNR